jgi:transposase
VHAEPADGEALMSWIWRLAARLGVPTHTLIRCVFGVDSRYEDSLWRRPDPMLLAQIERKTGVSCEHLLSMTFSALQPVVRDDEAIERLCARRFFAPTARRRASHRWAICARCLREDTEPYLRQIWTLGWIAVCPRHKAILVSRCPQCRGTLRFPRDTYCTSFAADCCKQCDTDLAACEAQPAHEAVVRLQEALLLGKRCGFSQLPGIGEISWPVAIAAMDVLLGMVRVNTRALFRQRLYERINRDFDLRWHRAAGHWSQCYGSLVILAWLLERWPRHLHAAFTILQSPRLNKLIDRWHDMDEGLRHTLRERLQVAPSAPRIESAAWHDWLNQLPYTPQELRERASHERYRYRRLRLLALAGLREGQSVPAVAALAGVWPRTVYRWLHCGAHHGLEAALERTTRQSRLTSAQAADIADWLSNAPERGELGFVILRGFDVVEQVKVRFGIDIPVYIGHSMIRLHRKRLGHRRRRCQVRKLSSRIRNTVHG